MSDPTKLTPQDHRTLLLPIHHQSHSPALPTSHSSPLIATNAGPPVDFRPSFWQYWLEEGPNKGTAKANSFGKQVDHSKEGDGGHA